MADAKVRTGLSFVASKSKEDDGNDPSSSNPEPDAVGDAEANVSNPVGTDPPKSLFEQLKTNKQLNEAKEHDFWAEMYTPRTLNDDEVSFLNEQDEARAVLEQAIAKRDETEVARFMARRTARLQSAATPSAPQFSVQPLKRRKSQENAGGDDDEAHRTGAGATLPVVIKRVKRRRGDTPHSSAPAKHKHPPPHVAGAGVDKQGSEGSKPKGGDDRVDGNDDNKAGAAGGGGGILGSLVSYGSDDDEESDE